RNEEAHRRRRLSELDLIECVLGLGPGLFYNSPMEACVVVCRSQKPKERQGKILFVDAVAEIARERAQSFLRPEHQQRILDAYRSFGDVPGLSAVRSIDAVSENDGNLSIPLYVRNLLPDHSVSDGGRLEDTWAAFEEKGRAFWGQIDDLIDTVDGLVAAGAPDA